MCPPDRRCPHRFYGRPRSLARTQRQGDMAVHRVLWQVGRFCWRMERRMALRQRRKTRWMRETTLGMAFMMMRTTPVADWAWS